VRPPALVDSALGDEATILEPPQHLVDLAARRRPDVADSALGRLRQVVTRRFAVRDEAENRVLGGRQSRWKSATVVAANATATAQVRRVRFRSTMCVPPCEAGVKPIPPKPVSRPECIRINPISEIESRTCRTETTWSTGQG